MATSMLVKIGNYTRATRPCNITRSCVHRRRQPHFTFINTQLGFSISPVAVKQSSLISSSKAEASPPKWLHTASATSSGTESAVVDEGTRNLLDQINVFDLNGNATPVSDLWKDRKAVVAFARHFGCVLCRKRADYLAAEKDKMDAAGVSLVLIGPGNVDQAKAFAEQSKFKGEVYADPNYSVYDALRFVSGVSTTFTPTSGLKIVQVYMEGYRQDWGLSFEKNTWTKGGWKQGGIIVAGPGKSNISYVHKDKEAGDDPPIEEILKACCVEGN